MKRVRESTSATATAAASIASAAASITSAAASAPPASRASRATLASTTAALLSRGLPFLVAQFAVAVQIELLHLLVASTRPVAPSIRSAAAALPDDFRRLRLPLRRRLVDPHPSLRGLGRHRPGR